MRQFSPYITTLILIFLLTACHSSSEPVTATPPPSFPEEPVHYNAPLLVYADTSLPEFKNIINRLDAYYSGQARAGFNGSVLVGYKGKVLYERYFGMANREEGIKIQPTSAVQLASVSKTLTAGAILYLHENNYLNIDSPVQDYLPKFPYPNITVRMLLSHRSGLPEYLHWAPTHLQNDRIPISNAAVQDMFARYKPPLSFKPNTRFTYCNSNYATLASIVEAVTEMKFADFMAKYIFQPLGMTNSFVYEPEKGLPQNTTISYKYNWRREPDMFADGVAGDKGIYSTVRDMYRWDQSFYKNVLLNPSTIAMAYTPYSNERKGIKNYGLGWRMLVHPDGEKVIYHNGWWHGNNTVFYRYIQDNYTIIILGNKYNTGIYRQQPTVYSIVNNLAKNDSYQGAD